jgi:hypothetical protein
MSVTRQRAEADVVNGLGATLLGLAGLATTRDGAAAPNPDLDGPLFRALDHLGYLAADPTNVTDADLAQVPPGREARFLDYLRIMVVDLARTRLAGGPKRVQFEDYQLESFEAVAQLTALRNALWAEYRRYLTSGVPAVGAMDRLQRHPLDTRRYFAGLRGCSPREPWPWP